MNIASRCAELYTLFGEKRTLLHVYVSFPLEPPNLSCDSILRPRSWFPVPDEASLVAEICQSIAKSFHLGNVALLLRCGGFALLPWLPASVVRDGDDIDVHVAVDAPEATTPDAQAVVAPEGRELAR